MTETEYLVDNIALFKNTTSIFFSVTFGRVQQLLYGATRDGAGKILADVSGTLIYSGFCVPLQVCVRADLRSNNEEDNASSTAAYPDLICWKSKSRVKNTASLVFTRNSPPRNVSGNVRCMCEEGLKAKLGRETQSKNNLYRSYRQDS